MFESLAATQHSVVYAEISGFVEKKLWLSAEYLFIVEVLWTDNRTTFVKRNYNDFFKFYRQLTNYFYEKYEKGILKTPVFIPKINGSSLFQRATRGLAEKREEELHDFLQQLLQGNPLVACNQIVVEFFLSRPTDPLPYKDPLDVTTRKKNDGNSTPDNHHENEDNTDEILFMK